MTAKTLIKKGKPTIMGILNFTPDSFSDGGKFNTIKNSITQIKQMEEDGADIIDIGGESTGPGSKDISLKEELKRTIPLIKEIRKHTKLPISIDTYKAEVARQALEEGANLVNDITALRGDKNMATVIKKYKCPIIMMHSKDKTARTTKKAVKYINVIKTIEQFLSKRIHYAEKMGIKKSQIIIDPGMGAFISTISQYSFEIIAQLKELQKFKLPILIGISRKSFLGGEMETRDAKSAALSAIAYINGASIIRTHNVKETILCLTWN